METNCVLRPEGSQQSGFENPVLFLFDKDMKEKGICQIAYTFPYVDPTDRGMQSESAF